MFRKIIFGIVFILILFLFIPIPFRYHNYFCESPPGKPGRICPREGDIGWNSPLIIQFIISATNSQIRTDQNVGNDKKYKNNVDSCSQNEDCEYVWFTGGCHTSEYVAQIQNEAKAAGTRNGEAPRREGVTCTCELNVCVTHN